MMTRRSTLLLPLALAACASPEPAYYTLRAVPGLARSGGPHLVELRRPGIAGYLDRSEIVRGGGGYKLTLHAGERWGEPFGSMLARVLAEDLNARLPGTTVFTASGSLSTEPNARVELDVPRFDLGQDGRVVLLAQVAVREGLRRTQTRSLQLEATPASASTADLVGAMSGLVGQAADAIAIMLRRR